MPTNHLGYFFPLCNNVPRFSYIFFVFLDFLSLVMLYSFLFFLRVVGTMYQVAVAFYTNVRFGSIACVISVPTSLFIVKGHYYIILYHVAKQINIYGRVV